MTYGKLDERENVSHEKNGKKKGLNKHGKSDERTDCKNYRTDAGGVGW